jgi:hypothetical protein
MRGFEIHLNGKRLCTAAVERDESVGVSITYGREHQFVDVRGSVGPEPTSQNIWLELTYVSVGDEILVKVVDTPQSDAPVRVLRHTDLWPNTER